MQPYIYPRSLYLKSQHTPEEAIQRALAHSDQKQGEMGNELGVVFMYSDARTGAVGQILSLQYATYLAAQQGWDEIERVHIYTPSEGTMIDYDQLADAVSAKIIEALPEGGGVTIEEIEEVVTAKLEPIKQELKITHDHAMAANMQTKPEV